jgi:glycogen operon protein
MITARRMQRDTEHEHSRLTLNQLIEQAKKSWHGVRVDQPDWSDCSHAVALTVELANHGLCVHMIFNSYWGALDFELPSTFDGRATVWRRWIDTALESPSDITDWRDALAIPQLNYHAEARSVVVLIADAERRPS